MTLDSLDILFEFWNLLEKRGDLGAESLVAAQISLILDVGDFLLILTTEIARSRSKYFEMIIEKMAPSFSRIRRPFPSVSPKGLPSVSLSRRYGGRWIFPVA